MGVDIINNWMETKFEGNTFNLAYKLMGYCFKRCESTKHVDYNGKCVGKLTW